MINSFSVLLAEIVPAFGKFPADRYQSSINNELYTSLTLSNNVDVIYFIK